MTDGAIKFEGLDEAIVGISDVWDSTGCIVSRYVYDGSRIIDILVDRDGMDDDEAYEFCSFNIEGAYFGPSTPIIVWGEYEEGEEVSFH